MSPIIKRLDTFLLRVRPGYYAQLRPGLNAEQFTEFAQAVGFTFPDEFRDLYCWRDGQADEFQSLCHNRYFMPSAEVKSTWELMTGLQEDGEWDQPQWWHRGWIPFLHNGAGSHLCVDLHGSFTTLSGQVIEFWNRDDDRPIVAPSFQVWLEHFVSTLERGFWHLEDDGNFLPSDILPGIPGYPIKGDARIPVADRQ